MKIEADVSASPIAAVMSQVFTPEVQAVVTGAGARLLGYVDELLAASAPVLEQLLPLVRNVAAVLSERRAGEYEELLIEVGYEPAEARMLSLWAISSGRRYAEHIDTRRREFGSALRKIVGAADRSTRVMARRAAILLPELDEWTRPWIEHGLARGGLPLSFEEFKDLVRAAAHRQPDACARLGEFAALIFPHSPKGRGKSLSETTVTHVLLLMILRKSGHRARYTYCP
jgi:hypothetical protein